MSRGDHDRRLPRQRYRHICGDAVIARALRVCVDSNQVAADIDSGFGGEIVLIRALLVSRVQSLRDHDLNLVVVGIANNHISTIAGDVQIRRSWKRLRNLIAESVTGPEEMHVLEKVVTRPVKMVAKRIPIETRSLSGGYAETNQHDQQKYPAYADAGISSSFMLSLLVLHQLNNAPQDEQHRPIMRIPVPEGCPVEHTHRPHEEHDSNNDQHDRPGERMTDSNTRRLYWANHFSPRWKQPDSPAEERGRPRDRIRRPAVAQQVERRKFCFPSISLVQPPEEGQAKCDRIRGHRSSGL